MKNLFIGGSSELALSVAKKLKNVDNISRSKNRIYKKNKIISNYSNNELKKNIKSLEENYSNILIFNGLYQRSLLTNFNTNKFNQAFKINFMTPMNIIKIYIYKINNG